MFKKHMTPLSRGGQLVKHAGKGAQTFTPPQPASFGSYAKATPMANPSPQPAMGLPPDTPDME